MKSLILFEGDFGATVAEEFRRLKGGASESVRLREAMAEPVPYLRGVDFVGLAAWRPYEDSAIALGSLLAPNSVPWSSAVIEGSVLRQGPVIPSSGRPCYSCYRRRLQTHWSQAEREQAIEGAYRRDPDSGLAGYMSGMVTLAAAGLLLDGAESSLRPGRLRYVDVMSLHLEETRVVRVHGCSTCAPGDQPTDRFVRDLRPALLEVLCEDKDQ